LKKGCCWSAKKCLGMFEQHDGVLDA
jgi:hypothetical protein